MRFHIPSFIAGVVISASLILGTLAVTAQNDWLGVVQPKIINIQQQIPVTTDVALTDAEGMIITGTATKLL